MMLGWTSLGAWGAAPAWAGLQWRGFLSRSRLNLIFLRLVLFRSLPFTLSLSFFSSLFLSLCLRPISLFLSVWQSKSPHIFFLSLSLLTKSDSRKERERHNKPNRRKKRRQTDTKKKTDRRREKRHREGNYTPPSPSLSTASLLAGGAASSPRHLPFLHTLPPASHESRQENSSLDWGLYEKTPDW